MRPRPHVLVLVIGAAAALLVSAPALGAGWLSTELPALGGVGTIQQSPAIAVDPAAPSRAAVVADDGTAGGAFPRTATRAVDWSADWAAAVERADVAAALAASTSAGQADVAWGIDRLAPSNVYAVEIGSRRRETAATRRAASSSGPRPTAARPTRGQLPVSTPLRPEQAVEPAIAVDPRRSAASTSPTPRLDYATGGCSGAPDSSQIWLAYATSGGLVPEPPRRGLAARGLRRGCYRSPALAVLPDGRVVVAFRNDAAPGPQIEARDVRSLDPRRGQPLLRRAERGAVGASVVVGDATAPALVSGLVGAAHAERRRRGRAGDRRLARERGERRARVRGDVDGRRRDLRAGPADRPGGRRQPGRPAARRDRRRPRRRGLPLGSTGSGVVQATTVSAGPAARGRDDRGLGAARRRADRRRQRRRSAHPRPGRAARPRPRRRDGRTCRR